MEMKIPYLKWRNGKPRWEPGPKLRDRGHKGQNLKDEHGAWLPLGDAVKAAEAINDAINGTVPKPRLPRNSGPLLSQVWEDFKRTPEWDVLGFDSKRNYISWSKAFLDWAGDMPVSGIKRKSVKNFWRKMHDERGHSAANNIIAVLRRLLAYAVDDQELMQFNPASNLKIIAVKPRIKFWQPEDLEKIVRVCDENGHFGVGDAIVVALHTAQRRGDCLTMTDNIFKHGRIWLTQQKTGAKVDFKATKILTTRVEAARERNAENVLQWPNIVIDDKTGNPFKPNQFNRYFAQMRHKAELDHYMFKDLRDTALTRLYLAKCTELQIALISGHSFKTVSTILKHYIALDADKSDQSIDMLEDWIEKEGVKI